MNFIKYFFCPIAIYCLMDYSIKKLSFGTDNTLLEHHVEPDYKGDIIRGCQNSFVNSQLLIRLNRHSSFKVNCKLTDHRTPISIISYKC